MELEEFVLNIPILSAVLSKHTAVHFSSDGFYLPQPLTTFQAKFSLCFSIYNISEAAGGACTFQLRTQLTWIMVINFCSSLMIAFYILSLLKNSINNAQSYLREMILASETRLCPLIWKVTAVRISYEPICYWDLRSVVLSSTTFIHEILGRHNPYSHLSLRA